MKKWILFWLCLVLLGQAIQLVPLSKTYIEYAITETESEEDSLKTAEEKKSKEDKFTISNILQLRLNNSQQYSLYKIVPYPLIYITPPILPPNA